MARGIYRRVIVALTAVLLWPSVVPQAQSHASEGCKKKIFGAAASSCAMTLGWSYDPASRDFTRSSIKDSLASEGVRYEYSINERCAVDAIDCGGAVYPCPAESGIAGRMYQSWVYVLDSAGVRLPGSGVMRNVCIYPSVRVPLAAVEAAVREEIQKRIPQPSVTSAPPGQSVVNFFTIFSTQPSPEQAITFTNPVPGEVRAVPEYSWDSGDGIKGLGPGTAFNPAILPSRTPRNYLAPTYAKPGTKHVTLTVTWRVTFRLERVIDVPLAPIVMTATEDQPIATARAVLVR